MKASKNPRGGHPKMMTGPMAAPKTAAHYERHARGVHRADGHMPGAPHSVSVKHAKLPNPKMGKGRGGY